MANENNEGWKTVLDFAAKFLLPFLIAWAGWQQAQIGKMDERIYTLQKEAVTEQKLQATEQRLTSYMDIRLSDLSTKQEMTNKYLEMVLAQVKAK